MCTGARTYCLFRQCTFFETTLPTAGEYHICCHPGWSSGVAVQVTAPQTVVASATIPLSTRYEPTALQVSRALAALIPHSQRRAIVKRVELNSEKKGSDVVRTWEIWFAGAALPKGQVRSPDKSRKQLFSVKTLYNTEFSDLGSCGGA